ncbi:MAG: HEAT repeat domain-containing protein [Phycisphaerales bacterium]|nr:MAG: HEAT repeat domain-containing protein [Phycisphaerales bacterium]
MSGAGEQPVYPRICGFLRASDNLAVEDAVLAALPEVSPQAAGALIDVILQRSAERGLAGLVRLYHRLPEAQQRRLWDVTARLSSALRAAMAEPGSQQRLNAISLIREGRDLRDAYLLATALCDSAANVSTGAADALMCLVSAWIAEQGVLSETEMTGAGASSQAVSAAPTAPPESYLLEAVRLALGAYHIHREDRVIAAALYLAGHSQFSFDTLFGDPPSRVKRAVLDVFRSKAEPAFVGFAYRALMSESWRRPVARAIGQRAQPVFIAGLIREVHWLRHPGVRQGLRSIRWLAWLRNGAAALLSLPDELIESGVQFLLNLGLPVAAKADLLRELVLTGRPAAQKPALQSIIEERYDTTGRLLRMVAGWGDPVLSPLAQKALPLHQDFALPGTLSLNRRPGPASAAGEPGGFDSFWRQYDQLPAPRRRQLGAEASQLEPHFNESLRFRCRSAKPAERLRAISVARCLGLESHLSAEILGLSRDKDRVVRSAALGALGGAPGPLNRRLLMEALQDHDARVRANAVEALDRLGYDRELAGLEGRLNDTNNRFRANLARAYVRLKPAAALETLEAMLASPDRSCRISALWVARDRGLRAGGELAEGLRQRIETMSKNEPDPLIRGRAGAVLAGCPAPGGEVGNWFLEELLR